MEEKLKNTNQPNLPMNKPTAKGFYVYCITSPGKEHACLPRGTRAEPGLGSRVSTEDGSKKFDAKGIDNKSSVFVLGHKDLGAIVSVINLIDFGENELKKKLNDLNWTKRTVLNHQRIINKVMDRRTVIPMRFGVIYKKKAQVEEMLKKNYQKFKSILESLVDKKEWGVKVFCDQSRLVSKIQDSDSSIKKLRKQLETSSDGKKFFLQKKINAVSESELEEEINKYSKTFLEYLSKDSDKYVLNNTSPKELTGRNEEMIINTAYLVDDKNFLKFEKELADLQDEYSKNGFLFELNGPWPPYNFVHFNYDSPKQANQE